MKSFHPVSLSMAAVVACGSGLPEAPQSGPPVLVSFDPELSDGEVAPVTHVLLEGELSEGSETLALYEGELSEYDLGRIRRNDLSSSLVERRVPVLRWATDGGWSLSAEQPLQAQMTYTLASAATGRIREFSVSDGRTPMLSRVWPPAGIAGAAQLVLCSAETLEVPIQREWIALAPGGQPALVEPGLLEGADAESNRCARITPEPSLPPSPARWSLPPRLASGVVLDPAPISPSQVEAPKDELTCPNAAHRFGPSCAQVLDDRMLIDPDMPSLWVADWGDGRAAHRYLSTAGAPFLLRDLVPGTEQRFSVAVWSSLKRSVAWSAAVTTLPPQPRVIINEVYANAVGPEPAQEWIELYNDGAVPVELSDFIIADLGGTTELPETVLDPASFALVVGHDYIEDYSYDLPPAEGTKVVRVKRVGKNGLANAGEPIELKNAEGEVVSAAPPGFKLGAGQSLARRYPGSLDDAADSFGLHADPGASPGAPNEVVADNEPVPGN